jgi:hypothetical protein
VNLENSFLIPSSSKALSCHCPTRSLGWSQRLLAPLKRPSRPEPLCSQSAQNRHSRSDGVHGSENRSEIAFPASTRTRGGAIEPAPACTRLCGSTGSQYAGNRTAAFASRKSANGLACEHRVRGWASNEPDRNICRLCLDLTCTEHW